MDYSKISVLRLLQYLEESNYTKPTQNNAFGTNLVDDPVFQELKHRLYRMDSNFTELEKLLKSNHQILD